MDYNQSALYVREEDRSGSIEDDEGRQVKMNNHNVSQIYTKIYDVFGSIQITLVPVCCLCVF